jgi:hypothetical protein
MESDYGDQCRELRDAKREARRLHGQPCPVCIEKLPRAHPSILLPQQVCKIHKYRDPRPHDHAKTMWGVAGYERTTHD